MLRIEWRRDPKRILLPCIIVAPFPSAELTGIAAVALIDTGSSVSGISQGLAERMMLRGLGKRPLKSAQGEGQTQRYAFRIGLQTDRESGFPFVFDEVIGIELTNAFEFSALIGMDILGQCNFASRRDGQCALEFG
jgi:hypothetical protein